MIDRMKQLYDMQKKAKNLQKQLEAIKVDKSNRDGTLRITVNGAQKVESIGIDGSWLSAELKTSLESALCQLINDAFSDLQRQTATQAAGLMKELQGFQLPGM